MISVWNEIVREGDTFRKRNCWTRNRAPHSLPLRISQGSIWTSRETSAVCISCIRAMSDAAVIYAAPALRFKDQNKTQISEALVKHCIMIARAMNYRILQFDAVAESNTNARTLYERLGFHPLGTIPNGFRMKDGRYENICPYYFSLV